MSLSALLPFYRRKNYARDAAAGRTFDTSGLDAEMGDVERSIVALVSWMRQIANADGTLKNLAQATAQALAGEQRFSASAAQTVFDTSIAWRSAFTNLNVAVFAAGAKLDPNAVTVANNAGNLRVTIAAQGAGTIVDVAAFESGAGVLTRLASVANGDGASLVGIEDAGGLYAAATVEAALAEVRTALNTLTTNLGALNRYILNDGTVAMAAALAMGGHKITGLAAATANGDAVRYEQLQTYVNALNALSTTYLPAAGGTMTGAIDMGANRIENVGAPTDANDAATKTYVDTSVSGQVATLVSPTGGILMYGGSVIPAGWLECDGSAVSRTTYANLFAAIGSTFGVGDGVNTFNLPDFRGRAPIGAGTGVSDGVQSVAITAGGTGYTTAPTVAITGGGGSGCTAYCTISGGVVTAVIITNRGSGFTSTPGVAFSGGGGSGAAATASLAMTARSAGTKLGEESHILTTAELAAHAHGIGGNGAGSNAAVMGYNFIGGNTQSAGGDQPHNTMQPSTVLRFIVKT